MIFEKKVYYFAMAVVLALAAHAPGAVVVNSFPSPAGYYAYGLTWDGQYLWCGDDSHGSIYKVDPSDGTPLGSIPGAPESNHGLAWDGTHLWVAGDYHTDYIYRVTTAGVRVDSILNPGGDYSGGLTWDGEYLWVSRYYPNTQPNLFKVDVSTGATVDTIPSQGLQPQGLAWDGAYLWNVQDDNDDDPEKVWKLDPSTGDTLMWFWAPGAPDVDVRPRGLTWDGTYLWLVAKGSGTNDQWLFQIDPYGAGPRIELSAEDYDYGTTIIGQPPKDEDWGLGISNLGDGDLIVDSLVSDSPAFVVLGSFPDTLAPDSSEVVTIRFSPPAYGSYDGTVTVYSNDPLEPQVEVTLHGFGIYQDQEIGLSELAHDYGSRRLCSTSGWTLTIQNEGGETLIIDTVFTDHHDFYPEETSFQIDPLLSLDLQVLFSPASVGSLTATMTIISNDADEETLEVALSGYSDDSPIEPCSLLWSHQATDYDPSITAIEGISDVNGDGIQEVISASENDTIYCFDGNSSVVPRVLWTYATSSLWRDQELVGAPDLDGDGVGDVVVGTPWGGRAVIEISGKTGEKMGLFDTRWLLGSGEGGWVYEVSMTADLNGDSIPEILAAAGDDGNGYGPGGVICLSGEPADSLELLWHKRLTPWGGANVAAYAARAIDDINDDGIPEVAVGTGDTEVEVHGIWMLDGIDGDILWMDTTGVVIWSVTPIRDLTGDGIDDIIAGEGIFSGNLYALNAVDGSHIWPPVYQDGGVEEVRIIPDVNESGYDDILAAGFMSGFCCYEGSTGQIIWCKPSGQDAYVLHPIPDANGDGVWDAIGGSGYSVNAFYIFNGKDGEIICTRPAESAVEAAGYIEHVACSDAPVALAGTRAGITFAAAAKELIPTEVTEPSLSSLPREFNLSPNYPNPFNPTTVIMYSVPLTEQRMQATLKVYNVVGQLVRALVDEPQSPGRHRVVWDGRDDRGQRVASGVYLYRLQVGTFAQTRRMVLIK